MLLVDGNQLYWLNMTRMVILQHVLIFGYSSICSPFRRGILKGPHVVNVGFTKKLGNEFTIQFWNER